MAIAKTKAERKPAKSANSANQSAISIEQHERALDATRDAAYERGFEDARRQFIVDLSRAGLLGQFAEFKRSQAAILRHSKEF